ncbi:MAG: hypothetical protein LBK05_03950 [Treponema sp.]|jgi:hypothetical protein|nr:hypothetical protein [Treponema sp.]
MEDGRAKSGPDVEAWCLPVLFFLLYFLSFFYFFDFAVKYIAEEFTKGAAAAQGIAAVSFFAAGKKDTSVKPGPCAGGARMRPKQEGKKPLSLVTSYTYLTANLRFDLTLR